MVARLAGDLVGHRRHHDVAFTGIGPSPDQRGVAFADAGVAHGVAFHAVGEEVPVLEVEADLGKGHPRSATPPWEVRQRSQTPRGPPERAVIWTSGPGIPDPRGLLVGEWAERWEREG
jgi:hypothetical protein